MGQSGKCHSGSVLGGMNPVVFDVDKNGPDTKGWLSVQRNRAG